MKLNPGREAEYERRHNPIWPELEEVLRSHGVHTYSIFLDENTGDLFAYVEFDDEQRWDAIANSQACRRWWAHMRDVMPTGPDDAPLSTHLREVFHL